jgi:very-short-patch-repair endonuclease
MALWEFIERWPARLDVMVSVDRRPAGITVHRSKTLARRDVRRHHGIPVTSPARTLLDSAPGLTRRRLTRIVNDALRSPFLTRSQLADVCRRYPRHPGAKLLRRFVSATGAPTRSEFEDRFLTFCEQFGLPSPKVNTVVCGHEVDALFDHAGVIVELDGWDFHQSRDSFERDRRRDADTLAAGLATIRITWDRITRTPTPEARRLRAILAQRRKG